MRRNQDPAALGEHVLEGGFDLGVLPGLDVVAGDDPDRAVAVPAVPGEDEGPGDQGERNGALDGTAGAVAGLAGTEDVAGVGEGLLDGPAGGVAGDQGDGSTGQVCGDYGEQAGVAVAGEDDPDGAGVQAAVPQAGNVGEDDVLVTAVGPGGGQRAAAASWPGAPSRSALRRGRPRVPGACRGPRSYRTALAGSRQVQITGGGRCLSTRQR